MKKTVLLPVFSDSVNGKKFKSDGVNPGCGGTQFVTIMLALLLARSQPDYEVRLLHDQKIDIDDAPDNLFQSMLSSFQEVFIDGLVDDDHVVIISPIALLIKVLGEDLDKYCHRIIPWIHHPFHTEGKLWKKRFPAYVSVGIFQYVSNNLIYHPHWHIGNIFLSPPIEQLPKAAPITGEPIRLVYLGALVQGKGLLDLARQWHSIKKEIKNVQLHIIGSAQTYGKEIEHELIPTTKVYASQLLQEIPLEDIEKGTVVFHGNLGVEKIAIIRSCHIAVLSPTGSTEAFPASPLECMSLGLPVVASADYGMSDAMQYFPELNIRSPNDISGRLARILRDPLLYQELSARSLAVSQWFAAQTPQILLRWQQLIENVNSKGTRLKPKLPVQPFYGSQSIMWYRKLRLSMSLLKKM